MIPDVLNQRGSRPARRRRSHHLAEQPAGQTSFAWQPGELVLGPRRRARDLVGTPESTLAAPLARTKEASDGQ